MIRRTTLLLPLLVLPLVACGSTVPQGSSMSLGAGEGLGVPALQGQPFTDTSQPEVSTRAGSSASREATSRTGRPSSPGNGASGGTASGRGAPTSGSAGSAPVAKDRSPVRVGLLYIDGADAAASSLGISGLSTGDAVAQAKAVVAHLNATGGLDGHPIDLREGRMDAASAVSDPEGTYSQACAALTQDEKVRYVVSYVNLNPSRLACYAQRGVTVLDDQSAIVDSAGAKYAKTFAGPGELALGRAADELVEALWRRGWLAATSKVGTLVPDSSDGAEVETRFLLPALARHGLKPAATFRATGANSANSTVLKYREAGVDRVIPMGQSPLFIMNAAEAQGYHPAYAMNSGFGPGALLESAAPPGQLENAAGIGWSKFLDIGAGTKPGPVSTNETLCFELMRKAGQQSTSATTQAFQVSLCNVLMFLKAAADRFALAPDMLEQVRAQGLSFLPADAFSIRMRPGRADGVASYRDVAYESSCSCFQYVSGVRLTR